MKVLYLLFAAASVLAPLRAGASSDVSVVCLSKACWNLRGSRTYGPTREAIATDTGDFLSLSLCVYSLVMNRMHASARLIILSRVLANTRLTFACSTSRAGDYRCHQVRADESALDCLIKPFLKRWYCDPFVHQHGSSLAQRVLARSGASTDAAAIYQEVAA